MTNSNRKYNREDNRNISGNTDTIIRSILVLNKDQYRKLEAAMPKPFVGDKTTDVQAGFQLGVQHVLHAIREGFTVDV